MSDELVLLERDGRVAYVTLNRPEKRNALNQETYARLKEVWAEVAADDSVRVAVLRGNGKSFCAGADLGGRKEASETPLIADRQKVLNMINAFLAAWDLPKPVVTQVHGHCFAGGSLLATLTDVIIVAEDAQIGWPKLPVGGGVIGPTWSWFISPHRAKEFSFTVGTTFTGREAVEMGWGNRAVPAERLEDEVRATAERIAKVPSDILQMKKLAHNQMMDARGFREALMHTPTIDALVHGTPSVHYVNSKISELGIKGAIAWFEAEGA